MLRTAAVPARTRWVNLPRQPTAEHMPSRECTVDLVSPSDLRIIRVGSHSCRVRGTDTGLRLREVGKARLFAYPDLMQEQR